MFYFTITLFFLLCRTSWSVAVSFPSAIDGVSKDSLLLNGNRTDVGFKRYFIESQHPHKVSSRQRRSLWMKFIEHIDSAINTLHFKPLLAESINDPNNIGKKFKYEFRDTPKTINAMLSEGAENGKEESEKVNKDAVKVNAETKTEEEMRTVIPEDVIAELKKKRNFENENTFYDTEEESIEDKNKKAQEEKKKEKELEKLNKEAGDLARMHEKAENIEEHLLEYLIKHKKKVRTEDLMDLYLKGTNHKESEPIIKALVEAHPHIRYRLVKDLKELRILREEIGKIEDEYTKKIPPLTEDDLFEINFKLRDLRMENKKWLAYKHHPDLLIIPKGVKKPPVEKEVEKVTERKAARKIYRYTD